MYQRDTVSFPAGKPYKPRAQVSTSYWVMFNAQSPFGRFISSKVGIRIDLFPSDAVLLVVLISRRDPYQTWLVSISWEEYGSFVFRGGSIGLGSELFAEKAM